MANTRRVVITGAGVVSSLGNNSRSVLDALHSGRSGVVAAPEMVDAGFTCAVLAPVQDFTPEGIPRRALQAMGGAAQFAASAALEAIAQAAVEPETLRSERTGAIVATAFGSPQEAARVEQILTDRRSPSRAGGTGIVKIMNSTAAGNIASFLGIRGRSYSVSSAFASGLDSIGHAYELIAFDTLDLVVAGAAEECTWRTVGPAMEATGALVGPSERPASELCRPYDRDREGLVLSEGAGIVILEGLDHARARGARPLAEIVAYASANDGADMFHPSGEGLRLVLADALDQAHSHGVEAPDYVNTHATGTRVGDALEAAVLREFFSDCAHDPWVSSSKGQAGHAMGATGAQELVYSLLMLEHGFLAPTMNLRHLDAECGGLKHVTERRDEAANCVLKLSAGFGGSNACVVFRGFDSAAGRAG